MSTPQRLRQESFCCPPGYQSEHTLFHTTRIIKYVFLDGSQNIVPPHGHPDFEPQISYPEPAKGYCYHPLVIPNHSMGGSCWTPDHGRLPIFVTLSESQEKISRGWGQALVSQDRLPIFRQLCGEVEISPPCGSEEPEELRTLDGEPGKVDKQRLEKQAEREAEKEEEEEDDEGKDEDAGP